MAESILDKVRVDKWLWSVRIFKSRSISTDAVKSGKIKVKEKAVKPSYLLTNNEILEVKKNGFTLTFKVLKIIGKRVSAPLAIECFEDLTPMEELNKYKDWYVGKSGVEYRERGEGRPTKKERREIEDFKHMFFEEEDLE